MNDVDNIQVPELSSNHFPTLVETLINHLA